MPPKISKADLRTAAKFLKDTIKAHGARVSKVRISARKAGLFALAEVNGKAVALQMPFGLIEWQSIAQRMIADAEQRGGVAQVM